MAELPDLVGVATSDLVDQIGGTGFKASYINWARTLNLLRKHAPGWMPCLVQQNDGDILHKAPVGAFLYIGFKHLDGTFTMPVPQAIMDNSNKAIPLEKITSRDVTDTHRRGVCMAAAFTFGLASELWAKIPLESGMASTGTTEDDPDGRWIAMINSCKTIPDLTATKKDLEADYKGIENVPPVVKAAYNGRLHVLKAA